ncbi:MAG: hypothetical protein Q8R92_18220 [Deltaproteobacteria bacterium]|nr:hypothetical protein [Deltaproteobacteria bacterium]
MRFLRRDLRDLHGCREQFDVAITVNAVLSPDAREVNDILRGIHDSLRAGGRLTSIFPAMEPVLYQAMLIHEEELQETGVRKRALARTRRRIERGKFNFELGLYDDGKLAQKFYYDFEIRYRLRRAGFRWVRQGKVFYPWDAERIGYELVPRRAAHMGLVRDRQTAAREELKSREPGPRRGIPHGAEVCQRTSAWREEK